MFSDLDLDDALARARRLEPQALGAIHSRYYPEIYRYVVYRLGDVHLSEDIASEVFLRFLDALHRRRGPNHNLRGWLIGTASNLVNEHLRKRYRRKVESIEDHPEKKLGFDPSPEIYLDEARQYLRVRRALQQLTPEQQHVLALRFADQYSLEETARIIGKKVGAVKALQFRALTMLRRLLEGKD